MGKNKAWKWPFKGKQAHLAGHGHSKIARQVSNESLDESEVVHQEGSIPAPPGYPLRAAEVQVDGVALALHQPGSFE